MSASALPSLSSERPLRELQRDDRVHEPLLRAVVQVAHDAAARLVARGEQARARGGELVAAVGVGDRGVEQLGELRHALLGVGGRRLLAAPARRDHAPQPAVDDDRRPDADAHADAAGERRDRPSARSKSSIRAGRPVRRTVDVTLSPVERNRDPERQPRRAIPRWRRR